MYEAAGYTHAACHTSYGQQLVSQRSLHNAPIFRLLLKVAVNGTHQCDFPNFCGQQCPTKSKMASQRRPTKMLLNSFPLSQDLQLPTTSSAKSGRGRWAEARIKITRMTLTIKLDRNWSSFQLANSAPPLSVTGSAIAPSARMQEQQDENECSSVILNRCGYKSCKKQNGEVPGIW